MGMCASSFVFEFVVLLLGLLLWGGLREKTEGGLLWYDSRGCLAVNGEMKAGTWLAERRSTLW